MDNKKIGKLIAKLRKEKELTQQELGDKVGVGFRAVSKWERGLTLPDISIINELSKILGISSDELLSGELKKKPDKIKSSSLNKTIILTVIILSVITLGAYSIIKLYQNKTYVYDIQCVESDKYYVEGQVSFTDNDISIIINKLYFLDEDFSSTEIVNYEYRITSKDIFLFGYGYNSNAKHIEEAQTIKSFAENFRVNFVGETKLPQEEIISNNVKIAIDFLGLGNEYFTIEIEISLLEKNKQS